MVIYNHNYMENIRAILDVKLLSQTFVYPNGQTLSLENARVIAQLYTRLESGISVLSDMKSRKSYIYYGPMPDKLGLRQKHTEIDSIWEDELLSLIQVEDLQKKYRLELRFFQLLKSMDVAERTGYEVITKLRTKSINGVSITLKHRLLYLSSADDESIWLALCLYTIVPDYPGFEVPDGLIINTHTGEIMETTKDKFSEMLSTREKEIMHLIKNGNRSKEIADKLSLSIHTVNRHRQNIFQKLNVNNAMEAFRMMEATGLL